MCWWWGTWPRTCSATRKGKGTLRKRSFPSLEAYLVYFEIVFFPAEALESPLEPQGLLLLESVVTVEQGRNVGVAEYTQRD